MPAVIVRPWDLNYYSETLTLGLVTRRGFGTNMLLPLQVMNLKGVSNRQLFYHATRSDFLICETAFWMTYAIKVQIRCPLDFHDYPFDTQMCPFVIYHPEYEFLLNRSGVL